MFKSKITFPLSIEFTFDLENINEFLKSGIELPDYDTRKFSERKVPEKSEGGSVFDKFTSRDLRVTFRVDVLPGPDENVDIFYHVSPSIHASVLDADIYAASESTLETHQKNYCSRNEISLFQWSLGRSGEVYMMVNQKVILATPSMVQKISLLRRNGEFTAKDELRDRKTLLPEDGQFDIPFDSKGQTIKVWGGVARSDFAYHNGLAHCRVTRIRKTIQYDTSIAIM